MSHTGASEPSSSSPRRSSLVRLSPVLEIIEAAIYSGRLQDEAPLSLCVVAESQSAKSQALLYFSDSKTLRIYSDITSKGILAELRGIENLEIRHIVLLDLHMVVAHNRYTADRTLITLGALMEEGLGTVSDAGGKLELTGLPKIGILMAVTPGFYHSRQGYWRKTGFLTRFLTVNYRYSDRTIHLIHDRIARGARLPDPQCLGLPETQVAVELSNDLADVLKQLAIQWGQIQDDPGFRFHRRLRTLAKSAALVRGSTKVEMIDITHVSNWITFFNPNSPVEL